MRRVLKWAAVVIVVVAVTGYGYWTWGRASGPDPTAVAQGQSIRIQPSVGPMEEVLTAVGSLEPLTKIEVLSRTSGVISEVAVQEGDWVEAGQLLVALDPTDLELAVTRARANLTSAQASLRKLLAGPSEAELLRRQNAVQQARLQVERLEVQVAQNRRLADQGAVAPTELAQLEQELALARQQLQLAEQELAELTQGPDPDDVEVAKAQVAQAEANLALAEAELTWAQIRSPLTGTVLSVDVELGQTIQEGKAVATVGRLDRMRVTVPVHEIDVNRVRKGLLARVKADAAPGRIFEGTVTSVATVGTAQGGIVSFDVTVELENADGLLRPGMTVDVEIVVEQKQDALRLPLEAIFRQNDRDVVLVAQPDGSTRIVPVQVGLTDGRYAEIISGLTAEDTVVIQAGGPSGARSAQSGRQGGPGGPGPIPGIRF